MAEIKKINTELQLESALRDGNGSPGTNGQILSSTGTATDWISLSEIQGVDGTGTANYISKWSDTDTITNSIIFDNGSNVGIGTTSPSQKLEVSGNILTGGGALNKTIGFKRTDGYNLDLAKIVSNGEIRIGGTNVGVITFNQSSSEVMRVASNGNVGIGTTSPTGQFQVHDSSGGNITISGTTPTAGVTFGTIDFHTQTSSGGIGAKITATKGNNWVSGNLLFHTGENNSTSPRMIITSSGNVGIGTNSPSYPLVVERSGSNIVASFESDQNAYVRIARTGASQPGEAQLRVTNNGSLNISSDSLISFDVSGSQKMNISQSGKVSINGTEDELLSLNSTDDGPVYISFERNNDRHAYVGFGGGTDQFYVRNEETNGSLQFTTLGGGMYINNVGNVGVNTTSPSKKLQVNGQTQFYEHSGAHLTHQTVSNFSFDTLANNASSSNGGSVGAYIKLTATPPGATGIWSTFRARAYGENAKGNTTGMITFFSEYRNYTSTNAVTLGYHAGLYVNPLGVGGLATVTNNYGVYLNPGTAATNNYGVYQNGSSVKNFFQGKVSIGTTTPNYPLTVVSETGNIGVAFFDSADNWERIYIGSTNDYIERKGSEQRITFAAQGSAGQFTFQTSGSEKLRITNSGNVGIGTTSPQSKLHVLGTTTLPSPGADGGAAVFGNTSSTDYGLVLGTETSGKSYIQSQRNDGTATTYALLVQPNGGNVGIGTTSPLSKLNVNGSIKIEGENQLYFGSSGSVPLWGIKALGNDLIINEQGTNSGDLIFTGQDFGVGITNPSEKLHVSGEPHPSIRLSSSSDSNYNVVINCGYRNEALNLSVGGYKVFTTEGYNTPETTHLYSNNSKALSLASNQAATFTSTVTATNFINSSDERLKENIEKVCNNSLDVQWKTFEFKSDRGQKRYGVIAQELEKTNPEFVREDAEGFKSVAYIDLLIAKIAELEERIQTLENK